MKYNRLSPRRIGRGWLALLVTLAMVVPLFSSLAIAEEDDAVIAEVEVVEETSTEANVANEDGSDGEPAAAQDAEPEPGEVSTTPAADDASEAGKSQATDAEQPEAEAPEAEDDAQKADEDAKGDAEGADGADAAAEKTEDGETPSEEGEKPADEETAQPDEAEPLAPEATLPDEETAIDEGLAPTIVKFAQIKVKDVDAKPDDLNELVALMPRAVTATLSNGEKEKVAVADWESYDYDDATYGAVHFTGLLDASVPYVLAEGVELPEIVVFIRYIDGVDPVLPDVVEMSEKPRDESDALAAMKLPERLTVSLRGNADSEDKTVGVRWYCEDYENAPESRCVFTSAFVDNPYSVAEGLEMPCVALSVSAFAYTVGDDNAVTITGWKGSGEALAVPDRVDGRVVKAIAEEAFADHPELETVTLPDGLEQLGSRAFAGCEKLRWAELPDSLIKIGKDVFDEAALNDLRITLAVYGKTYVNAQNAFKQAEGGTVKLPRAIDNIRVVRGGSLIVKTDYTVETGCAFTVEKGAKATLSKAGVLLNRGTVEVKGTFANKGAAYGCPEGSRLDGEIAGYVSQHAYDLNGVCTQCGDEISDAQEAMLAEETEGGSTGENRTVTVTVKSASSLNKVYDGTTVKVLGAEASNAAFALSDATAAISSATLTFESAAVGTGINVTVSFILSGDSENTYTAEDLKTTADITAKPISDKEITVDNYDESDLEEYPYSGGSAVTPEFTLTYKGVKLEKDKDYTVSYSNNTDVDATGVATVAGAGNFGGSRDIKFKIVNKTVRLVTVTLKEDATTSREYDSTKNLGIVKVKKDDDGNTVTDANGKPVYVLSPAFFTKSAFVIDPDDIPEGETAALKAVKVDKPDKADAGSYTLNVSFAFEKNDKYIYRADDDSARTVVFQIKPKNVALSVVNADDEAKGLVKGYGDADPNLRVSPVGLYSTDVDKLEYELTWDKGEDIGEYAIRATTLTAGDNYSLSLKNPTFRIEAKKVSELTLTPIADQKYTGKEIKPDVTLKNGETRLVKDVDYTLDYEDNQAAGEATVKITGIGNYTGTRKATFNIKSSSSGKLSNTVEFTYNAAKKEKPSKAYDGTTACTGLKKSDFVINNVASGDTVNWDIDSAAYDSANAGSNRRVTVKFKITSQKSSDYEYSTQDCVITGCAITPLDLSDKANKITVADIATQSYSGTALKPTVKVTWNKKELEEKTDFTVEYSNNTLESGKTAGTGIAVVKGIGNFTGSVKKEFEIIDERNKDERPVKVTLKSGKSLTKVYDKSSNCGYYDASQTYHPLVEASDFKVEGAASGDKVTIEKVLLGKLSKPDVGTQTATVKFTLTASKDNKYRYKLSADSDSIVKVNVTRRTIVVEPKDKQNKYYGSKEPTSFAATVSSGLLTGDKITGALGRESGEKVGKYKYNVGTLSAGTNYNISLTGSAVFTILPKPISDPDVTVGAINAQRYTGSPVKPEIVLRRGTTTLTQGTDFTVTYANNTKAGTATATIRGKGNYTGTRSATFRIVQTTTQGTASQPTTRNPIISQQRNTSSGGTTSRSTSTSRSSSTSRTSSVSRSSSTGSSTVSSADDSDSIIRRGDSGSSLVAPRATSAPVSRPTVVSDLSESEDPVAEQTNVIVEAASHGELILATGDIEEAVEEVPVGYVLFSEDNRPRGFQYTSETIEPMADEAGMDIGDAIEPPVPQYRLVIEPEPMKDIVTGETLSMAEDASRERYELVHLRLTPGQVETLQSENYTELVYRVEDAELRVPLADLPVEIEVAPEQAPEAAEEAVEAEAEAAGAEAEEAAETDGSAPGRVAFPARKRIEKPTLRQTEATDGAEAPEDAVEEEAVAEVANLAIAGETEMVDNYVFTIEQVEEETLTDRERAALADRATLMKLYRVNISAVNGDLEADLSGDAEDAEKSKSARAFESLVVRPESLRPDATYFPILDKLDNAELRVNGGLALPDGAEGAAYALPEGAVAMVVSDDPALTDAEAVTFEAAQYVADDSGNDGYAAFAPRRSGLYTLVLGDGAETEAGEASALQAGGATGEDPEPLYAYKYSNNLGDRYWLINTQTGTVESYRTDTGEYAIGHYAGSLLNGLEIAYDGSDDTATMSLKFAGNYKYVSLREDGPEQFIKREDAAVVETIIAGHR